MNLEFISYPKSGRSWLRYALTRLEYADSIKFHHDGFEFNARSKPLHEFSLESRITRYQGQSRIVYLERDPRDTMVSLYFQITGRYGPVFEYQHGISEFIRDDYFGAQNLLKFRSLWNNLCAKDLAIKVTYEQCHQNFVLALSRIGKHYSFDLSQDQLVYAKESASFERMKSVELSETFPKNWLKPKNGAKKVRKGVVGGYHEYLTDSDITYLNKMFSL